MRTSLTFARLMTALVAFVAVADVITRGRPIDGLSFRAWEAMSYYRMPGTAFEPSRQYDRRSWGDLANIGNLPAHRTYRREVFTTDKLGFRNPEGFADSGRAEAILIGDSFSAGSSVSDHETLPAQLGSRGIPTYNVAPMRLDADGIRAMAARLRMTEGWVFYQQVSGVRYVYVAAAGVASVTPADHRPVSFYDRFERNLHTPTFPLRIAADRWLKSWQDDRWFTNPYKSLVEIRHLANGDTMLFFPGEVLEPTLPAVALDTIQTTVDLYRDLMVALKDTRLKLAVILVPDRFSAYAHLLAEDAWTGGTPPYQYELDRRLRDAGVPVVNLYPAMAKAATDAAARWEYLYWRDDTHWNARGIGVAADEVAAWLSAPGGAGK